MKIRNLLLSIAEFALCGFLLAAVCVTLPPAPTPPPDPAEPDPIAPLAATTMPIEVLGTNGTIRRFTVVVTNGNTADNIWFKVYNLSFNGKMSVRVNGSNWVTLSDANVVYPDREVAQFGMGGISEVLRFHYTLDGEWTLVNGTNTFDFRFNDDTNSLTIGYRVLDFSPRAGTNRLITYAQFVQDDPATWTPPSTNALDIADGLDAWLNLTITERGTNIITKCKDCHAWNGRDLKYFNYSAKSIIERSIFHSVPANRATNIASYILSLNVPYATNARPWNPPYQPGPGMDVVAIDQWAAGAGFDAVQDNGTNGLSGIFPSGMTTNSFNRTNSLPASRVPLSTPFPSWNKWLPKIHPYDYDYTFFSTNEFITIYDDIRSGITNKTGADAADYFNGRKNAWDGAATPAWAGETWKVRRDRNHFRVVKTWEIMTEFNIQDYGSPADGIFPAPANGAAVQDRRWFHGEVFRLGPHVLNVPNEEKDTDIFFWESTQWYQLQLVLNDGARRGGTIVPIDWGYQHSLNVSAWTNPNNFATFDSMWLNIVKAIEVGFNGLPMTNGQGFNPFKANVWRLESEQERVIMDALPDDLQRPVTEAIAIRWLEQMESYTQAEFAAAGRLNSSLNNLLNRLILWWGPTKLNIDSGIHARLVNLKAYLFS